MIPVGVRLGELAAAGGAAAALVARRTRALALLEEFVGRHGAVAVGVERVELLPRRRVVHAPRRRHLVLREGVVAVGVRVDERAAAPAGAALPAGSAPPAGAALALRRRRGDPLVLGHLPVAVGVRPVDPLLVVAPFLAPLRRHFIGREVAVPIFVHRAVLLGVRAHLLVLGTDEGAARGGGVEEGRGAGGGAEVMRRGEGVGSVVGARGGRAARARTSPRRRRRTPRRARPRRRRHPPRRAASSSSSSSSSEYMSLHSSSDSLPSLSESDA